MKRSSKISDILKPLADHHYQAYLNDSILDMEDDE